MHYADVDFQIGFFYLLICTSASMSFDGFSVMNTIPFSGCFTVYPFTYPRTSWLLPSLAVMTKAITNIYVQDFVRS